MKNLSLLFFFLLASISMLTAQRGWETGFWGGATHYFGDLNTDYGLDLPGPAGGIAVRYNFNNRVCLKFSGNALYLRGSDHLSDNIFERSRNLSFQSMVYDGTAQFEINFLPYEHGSIDHYFTPYMLGGISVLNYNPKAKLDDKLYELRTLGTEGQFLGDEYSTIATGVTYGLGFKFDLNHVWSINIELAARYLFTDYLDDVSTVYPDEDDLRQLRGDVAVALSNRSIDIPGLPDELGREKQQRGDAGIRDGYATLGVSVMYYFGGIRCPKIY